MGVQIKCVVNQSHLANILQDYANYKVYFLSQSSVRGCNERKANDQTISLSGFDGLLSQIQCEKLK